MPAPKDPIKYAEWIRKNREAHMGKVPWNAGMKMSAEHCLKLSKSHIGQKSWNKGQTGVYSEETRQKMSQARMGKEPWNKGKKMSDEYRRKASIAQMGRVPWNKGKTGVLSKESLEKMSVAHLGQRPGNWRGGVSFEPYPVSWNMPLKEKVRSRDGQLCQLCGKSEFENGQRLCVHHINEVKDDTSYWNLISLCRKCHSITIHRSQLWQAFFEGERYLCENRYSL